MLDKFANSIYVDCTNSCITSFIFMAFDPMIDPSIWDLQMIFKTWSTMVRISMTLFERCMLMRKERLLYNPLDFKQKYKPLSRATFVSFIYLFIFCFVITIFFRKKLLSFKHHALKLESSQMAWDKKFGGVSKMATFNDNPLDAPPNAYLHTPENCK